MLQLPPIVIAYNIPRGGRNLAGFMDLADLFQIYSHYGIQS